MDTYFFKEFAIVILSLFYIVLEIVVVVLLPALIFLNPWILLGYEINLFDKLEIFKNYQGISPFIGATISSIIIYIICKIYDSKCRKK